MKSLNQNKVQIIQNAINGDKLLQMIQDIPKERVEKVFQNKDFKKIGGENQRGHGLVQRSYECI